MAKYLFLLVLIPLIHNCVAPPVSPNKDKSGEHGEDNEIGGLEDYMEYHRYLKEVVNALESDPDFRKKLENAEEHDIKSGKIADELEFVSHHVRTRLDEIKRIELDRLKDLTEKKRQLLENIDNEDPTHHGHVDHSNPHTFEIDDLKKLIAKTTEDLAEADRKRREEFKEYELQKEFSKQMKLNKTEGEERARLEKEFNEREEKHKKHEKLHEPGHKAQLEEVWEEQDQMQQEFDPRTFFMLHDVDSNGLWDQDEVKALFIKELEKMYKEGEPEDDMRERIEEMERMRESVFKEVDLNRDGFIDYQEFLAQTKRNDFQQDHGWQGLDERKPYTDEELQVYMQQHQEMLARQGGYPHPQGYGQVPPGYHHNQPQYHPGQVPGHLPDLNTNEIYPNGQQHSSQGHQQQHNPQVQQGYQQQHPPQGYQQQVPPQGYQHHQQPPQGYQQQPPPQGYQQKPPQHMNSNQHPPQQINNVQQPPQPVNNAQHPPQQVNNAQHPPQQVNNAQQPPQQVNNAQQLPQQVNNAQQPPQQVINVQQSAQPVNNVHQPQPPQQDQLHVKQQPPYVQPVANQGSPQVKHV